MHNFQRWMAELVAWNMSQNAQIQHAAAAVGYGLDPTEIGLTPFPGTAQPVTIHTTITPPAPASSPTAPTKGVGSYLWPLLASAGLLAGGAGLGVSTGVISNPLAKTPATTLPAAETVTWESTDGGKSWKTVPVSPQP